VRALDCARKVPLIYCRVGLPNWLVFADAKISSVAPRGDRLLFDSTSLAAGAVFGSAYGPTPNTPAQPATLSLTCTPDDPKQLTQLASDERDIASIMLTRWNYGYAYELCSTFDPSIFGPVSGQPQFRARQPFANVSIANSDSGAFAYAHSAIDEAFRAVQDLLAH
jgi:spermidine dehydrogenase